MSFDFLFQPVEELDALLTGLFDGAPLLVALGLAFVLGLRHASDPDHLVAVTSLVAADDGDTRAAARLGAWWGLGHAAMLLVIGLPLIAFKSALPAWLETRRRDGRRRGDPRARGARHLEVAARRLPASAPRARPTDAPRRAPPPAARRRREHRHVPVRSPRQAFGIGIAARARRHGGGRRCC